MGEAYTVVCTDQDPEWGKRRIGPVVTASMASAVLGNGKHFSILDAYNMQLGDAPEREVHEAMTWGNRLQRTIVDAYQEQTGRTVEHSNTLLQSVEYPWAMATLDGWVTFEDGSKCPLEIKNVSAYSADDWENGCPDYLMPQLCHQMLVTDTRMSSIAALIGGNRLVWADVCWDDSYMTNVHIPACERFIEMVRNGTPPPPDGTKTYTKSLAERFPQEELGSVCNLGQDELRWTEKLIALEDQIKVLESEKNKARQHIMAALGDKERGTLPGDAGVWRWHTINRKEYTVKATTYRELRRGKR